MSIEKLLYLQVTAGCSMEITLQRNNFKFKYIVVIVKEIAKWKVYRGNLPYGLEAIGLSDYEEPVFMKMKIRLTAQG